MDKIKNLIKDIIKASDKHRTDISIEEQLDEVKALANELDYNVSHYKKPKIYVFKSNYSRSSNIVSDWDTIIPILYREGYKIEIVKIKRRMFRNVSIYYRFVEI